MGTDGVTFPTSVLGAVTTIVACAIAVDDMPSDKTPTLTARENDPYLFMFVLLSFQIFVV
jgi:hypothetical protein